MSSSSESVSCIKLSNMLLVLSNTILAPYNRAGYRSVFFNRIFVSIQIDRYLIYHLIHALKTVINEIFVKFLQ